ncbi:MAG: hypothetical protein SGPRY_012101 [Prymnesium sp.]
MLVDFIRECKQETPVYIGWGSMVSGDPAKMSELAIRALFQVGRRGVVVGGWANLSPSLLPQDMPDTKELMEFASKKIIFVKEAPHEWLFRRCAVIVHHGGAGTTAAALRSGVPSIVTPCFADQPELAAKTKALGVGIALKQFRTITPKKLQARTGASLSAFECPR